MGQALDQILDSVKPDQVIDGKRVMLPRPGAKVTGTIESVKHARETDQESLIEATIEDTGDKVVLPGVFGAWHSPGAQFQARSVYTEDVGSGWSLVSSNTEERELSAAEVVKDYEQLIRRVEEEKTVLRDGLEAFGAKFVPDEPYGTKLMLPVQLKREDAIVQAQNEIGGSRFVALREQVEKLDRKDLENEKKITQLNQMLGSSAARDRLLGKSFLLRRQITQETKIANKTREALRKLGQEYNVLVEQLRTPQKKAKIAKRVDEMMLENKREFEKISRIQSAYKFTSLTLIDARETKSEFELLGQQKVRVIGKDRAIPADRKSFDQSIQKAQELKRAISRDLEK